jgi:hypothetical protein
VLIDRRTGESVAEHALPTKQGEGRVARPERMPQAVGRTIVITDSGETRVIGPAD